MLGWGITNPFHHESDLDFRLLASGGGGKIASSQTNEPEIHQNDVKFLARQQRQRRRAGIRRTDLARAVSKHARTLLPGSGIKVNEQYFPTHGGEMKACDGHSLHQKRGHA